MGRAPSCEKMDMKKGQWSPQEDFILIHFILQNGHTNWRTLPKQAGLLRCGKSCRLRWNNYLRPDIKRGNFTSEEEETIIKLHESLGNRWSAIAAKLPGRTDNEIKNVWHSRLKRKLPLQTHLNNSANRGPTTLTNPLSPATAINAAAGLTKKRSRKADGSKKLVSLSVSTHEKNMEANVNNEDTNNNNNNVKGSPTSTISIEPVSLEPYTTEVSTVTNSGSTSASTSVDDTSYQDYAGDLANINDGFWMEALLVEDLHCLSQSKDGVLGNDLKFEPEYGDDDGCEVKDAFWHNFLTKSEELPEITKMM